jgi:class 3 adenylate cyclase
VSAFTKRRLATNGPETYGRRDELQKKINLGRAGIGIRRGGRRRCGREPAPNDRHRGRRRAARPGRQWPATVLFTNIVGSTSKLAEFGDRRWKELLQQHHAVVRRQLVRFAGREIDTAGDGFFASFDGPARAIRCACAITESVRELGLDVRAGLHTGECEVVDGKVGGIAVHIGARVASEAGPGQVLVSGTVKDLVAGSGIEFQERGPVDLKGVPGEWRLYSVAGV